MFNNPVTIIAVVEIAVVLVIVFAGLLIYIRSQRSMLGVLEDKVVALRDMLKRARADTKAARAEVAAKAAVAVTGDFGEFIDEQIALTRNHHLSLNPDRDIVLDIGADTPLERRAVSLRHAFLIAEKEAWLASEDKEIDWAVLSGKLAQIIEFYEQAPPAAELDRFDTLEIESEAGLEPESESSGAENGELANLRETIANQKRHIENLERFKTLFFSTDEKWRAASEQAEQYHQELLRKSRDLGVDADYEALLENYSRAYDDFDAAMAAGRGDAPRKAPAAAEPAGPEVERPSVGRMVIANQEEVQRLRNMAVDQHKMIMRLREELNAAQSSEDKERVIIELHKQLERHERFLKESDLCTKQLENELDRVLNENQGLKIKLQDAKMLATAPVETDANVEQMVKIIEDFTEQASDMLNAIEALETECGELRARLAGGGEEVEGMRQQLAAAQTELQALQAQHVDLEERYLELKVKSG